MPGLSVPKRAGFCAIWLLLVGAGFVFILNYQNTAGGTGHAPRQWPSEARMALDPGHDTLLMFAHPRCPCTRASLEELNRLMAHAQGKVTARVLFFRPAAFPDDWARTDLWRSAAAIPGVAVQEDSGRSAGAPLWGRDIRLCPALRHRWKIIVQRRDYRQPRPCRRQRR